jgi:hypothetical protein
MSESPHFDGATYNAEYDHDRLTRQLTVVKMFMLRTNWQTLAQIEEATGFPQASISARLRDLRKKKFGGYTVLRKRVVGGKGTHMYRVVRPDDQEA